MNCKNNKNEKDWKKRGEVKKGVKKKSRKTLFDSRVRLLVNLDNIFFFFFLKQRHLQLSQKYKNHHTLLKWIPVHKIFLFFFPYFTWFTTWAWYAAKTRPIRPDTIIMSVARVSDPDPACRFHNNKWWYITKCYFCLAIHKGIKRRSFYKNKKREKTHSHRFFSTQNTWWSEFEKLKGKMATVYLWLIFCESKPGGHQEKKWKSIGNWGQSP